MLSEQVKRGEDKLSFLAGLAKPTGRRTFLKWSGTTVAVLAIGCGDDDDDGTGPGGDEVNLGTGDTGILNYAYALEQLEAAFYIQVVATPYTGISAEETTILTDIRDHEVAHRDFFAAALGDDAIDDLAVDFAGVDFDDRASVLMTARTFEDLGVTAYNGAGQLLMNPAFLTLAGKIVSVEARHASAIRDLLAPRTGEFAPTALDGANPPATVLAAADPFIETAIDASGLPTS